MQTMFCIFLKISVWKQRPGFFPPEDSNHKKLLISVSLSNPCVKTTGISINIKKKIITTCSRVKKQYIFFFLENMPRKLFDQT